MKRSSLRPRAASSFPWLPEEQCCARGQWEAIVDHETWCRSRNSRHHRARHEHLGLDQAQAPGFGPVPLYSVWLQGDGAPRGYRCAGHVRRTGSHIDELVTEVIAGRLGQPDALAKHQTSGEAFLGCQKSNAAPVGSGRLSSTTRPGAAQEILDITERVTNTSDSTKRKHLVLGLYRCTVCGCRVMGHRADTAVRGM